MLDGGRVDCVTPAAQTVAVIVRLDANTAPVDLLSAQR